MKSCNILISFVFFICLMETDLSAQYLFKGVRGNTVRSITSDNRLLVWGGYEGGSFGDVKKANSSNPLDITNSGVLNGKRIMAFAAGENHCVALKIEAYARRRALKSCAENL